VAVARPVAVGEAVVGEAGKLKHHCNQFEDPRV
jgi:hypothetical protein